MQDNIIEELQIEIIYSKRKTVCIQIKADSIVVRAPKGMSKKEISDFVGKNRKWIEKHWKKMQERKACAEQFPVFSVDEIKELKDKALKVIPKKVKKYAPIVGVDYVRITIRNQRTRWGSCSSKGNLNFNCLLMLCPDEVIDYVVVHELCHRIHMNHSAEFYAEVERVLPEYRKYKKWLEENGEEYISRIQ